MAATVARIITVIVGLAASFAGMFYLAGRIDWTQGWIFVVVLTVGQSLNGIYVLLKNPEVIAARRRPGEGTKAWDKVLLSLFGLAYVGIMVVGALDSGRYAWSSMPLWTCGVGAGLYALNLALASWAMGVNRHFEKTARIQSDRNHAVVEAGPYRYIRHPGYAGAAFGWSVAGPLLLGSWWAFVPAGVMVLVLAIRTALEDRMLRRELDGYAEYAARVRYQIVPGIW